MDNDFATGYALGSDSNSGNNGGYTQSNPADRCGQNGKAEF